MISIVTEPELISFPFYEYVAKYTGRETTYYRSQAYNEHYSPPQVKLYMGCLDLTKEYTQRTISELWMSDVR